MNTTNQDGTAPRARRAPLARIFALILGMTVWADVNDALAARYHLGFVTLNVLRTVVDCGGVVWLGCVVWGGHSLRELGWRFCRPLPVIAAGLLLTALSLLIVFGLVTLDGGPPAAR